VASFKRKTLEFLAALPSPMGLLMSHPIHRIGADVFAQSLLPHQGCQLSIERSGQEVARNKLANMKRYVRSGYLILSYVTFTYIYNIIV